MTGSERATVAFFGIKGIGSVYYLAYALSAEDFAATATLWSTVAVTILLSPFLHGMLATTVLGWLDRHPR